ncbi:hypothetical protein IWX62_002588 [Arthrobacter sp. CAN_A1]
MLEPGCKGLLAVDAAGEHLAVGPFGSLGVVEAFGLAVGPGAVGFDEALGSAEPGDGLLEGCGVSVGERVVGDDAVDPVDAGAGEVRGIAGEGPGRGGALLIGRTSA